jgi:hypothetical protein
MSSGLTRLALASVITLRILGRGYVCATVKSDLETSRPQDPKTSRPPAFAEASAGKQDLKTTGRWPASGGGV